MNKSIVFSGNFKVNINLLFEIAYSNFVDKPKLYTSCVKHLNFLSFFYP